ncbi:MAG: hypothetical protein JRJ27_11710 [Deltaproteobacteria bacterium]|nr:hypothetical protein [Deltaproteobacteria bacterium]
MKISQKEMIRRWVKTWKRAGPALKEVKRRELREYDYLKNRKVVDEMLQWAIDNQKVRLTSGLVEQQRLFMKMKRANAPERNKEKAG